MFGGQGGGIGGFGASSKSGSGLFGMPAPTDLVSGTLSSSTASGFAVKPPSSVSASPPFGSKSLFGTSTESAGSAGAQNVFGSVSSQQQSSGLFGSSGSTSSTAMAQSGIFGSQAPLFGNPPAEAGKTLFGKPSMSGPQFSSENSGAKGLFTAGDSAAGAGMFKGGDSGSSSGLFTGGSSLFGGSQSSIKRTAGTRPNTPVQEETEESIKPPAPSFSPSLFTKPPPSLFGSDKPAEKTESLFEPQTSIGVFGAADKSAQPSTGLFGRQSGQGATARFLEGDSSDSQKLFSKPKINRDSGLFAGKAASAGGIFTTSGPKDSSRRSIKSRLGAVVQAQDSEEAPVFSQPPQMQPGHNPFVWTKSSAIRGKEEAGSALFGKVTEAAEEQEEYFERGEASAEHSEERDISETESEMSEQSQGAPFRQPPNSSVRRSVSREELVTITSVKCEEVPDVINKVAILSKHFSKFGEVVKIVPNIKKKTAMIHYSDHEGAKQAKKKGKIVNQSISPIGHIFYCKSPPHSKAARKTHSDPEVKAELAGMSGSSQDQFSMKAVRPVVRKKVFSMTKALQSSAEDRPAIAEPEAQITLTQGASIMELMRIMKQQTHSDDDRWKVLDARDKYIRLKYPKKQLRSGLEIEDMNLIGTCPDICPEKERYGRSAKNQLRWYEKEDGKLNHLTAVKEHSRSAADQDVPLPHELRPASVLNKTMNYLMCNIVDRVDNMTGTMSDWFNFISQLSLGEVQPTDPWAQFYVTDGEGSDDTVGDWYEYMWSVTRAIRKDITQQNLTDLVALSIVEKCARFHIFCSERLCEEDAHNFDRKLNDENLTKCLRTLKHMYHDLQVSGVFCPQESEFRAYDVLMNLNEGDTLREIQTLSEEIQKDPQVLFALKCFKALNSNNYVLFFKLVKKATYLEACILKRYFYQVRKKAVQTIITAYVPPKQVIHFPVENIVSWLAFESGSDCTKFLRLHGIESEDDVVFLERRAFVEVENVPAMTRSRLLIDSKKTVSLGEIVNGGPLAENPYLEYYPHDSFDDNGFLKPESYEAQDQEVRMSPEELERITLEEELRRQKKELASDFVEDISTEVCIEEARTICQAALKDVRNKEASVILLGSLETEFIEDLISSVATEALREKRNDFLKEKLLEDEKAEREAELCSEIIDGWVETLVRDICQEEMNEVIKKRKLQKYLKHAEPLAENVIEAVIMKELEDIAKLAIKECEQETEDKIRRFSNKLRNKQMVRILREWKRLAGRAARQRETILKFPAGVAPLSSQEQNSRLGWSDSQAGRRPGSLQELLRNRQQLDWMLRAKDLENAFVESAILEPFPLVCMLEELLTNSLQALQWKLLLSCPAVGEAGEARPYLEMVRRKLRKSLPGESSSDGGDNILVSRSFPFCETLLTVSVVELPPASQSLENLRGSSCSLFIYLPSLETEEEASRRFDRLVELLPVEEGGVPVVLLSSSSSAEADRRLFGLDRLVEKGIIKRYDRFAASENIFDVDNVIRVTEGVATLVKHSVLSPSSRMTTKIARDFVEDFLTCEVFSQFYINLRDRRTRDLPHRPPSDLLALYNSALEHCVWVLEEGEASQHAISTISNLKLPDMIIHDTDSWRHLVEQVLVYLDNIAVVGVDTSVTVANIERYLARSYRQFMSRCGDSQLDVRSPPQELLAWTDIVHSLVMYRLAGADLNSQEKVSYLEERLDQWVVPREWGAGLGWMGEREQETVQETVNTSLAQARERTMIDVEDSPCTNRQLRDSLRREQKKCMRLEAMLEEAIADEKPASQILRHPVHSFDMTEDRMEEEVEDEESEVQGEGEEEMVRTTQAVPLISYLSPTLGRLVSPYSVLTRQESLVTGMSPRLGRTHSSVKRKAESGSKGRSQGGKKVASSKRLSLSPSARPVRSDLDQKLDTLKVTLRHQVEEDVRFEKMLESALM